MATTRQSFVHYNKTGGMSRAGRPFLLPPEVWHTCFNMRPFEGKLTQLPMKKVREYVTPQSGRTLMELANIPTPNGSVLVGLTEDRVKRIESGSSVNLKEAGTEVALNNSGTYERYSTCLFNHRLFFTNRSNKVKYTDGATVTSVGGTAPSGRHLEMWFDHLVIGGPQFAGEDLFDGVAWSNLHDFSNFTPDTDSEADRYVFTEYQSHSDVVPGVTGLKKLGNSCIVYTASSIYQMRYTGLPRVVRVDPVIQDFGCGFMYSLASVNGQHFFIDTTARNFLAFNGRGIELIGSPISDFFFETLSDVPDLQQRTFAYVDQRYREIWWVYVSEASSGAFDRAVVYNYAEKKWFAASVEDTHCFSATVEEGAGTIDQLPGTINSLNGTCDRLAGGSGGPVRLWGGPNERLMQEEEVTDVTTDLLVQETPVLETGDEVYGGVQQVKEVSDIALQCTMATKPELVEVELAVRQNVDDPVVFEKVGLWTPTKKPVLSLEKAAGRVMRWRFHPLEQRVKTIRTIYRVGTTDFSLRTNMPDMPVVGGAIPVIDDVDLSGWQWLFPTCTWMVESDNPNTPPADITQDMLSYWIELYNAEWPVASYSSRLLVWYYYNVNVTNVYDFRARYAAEPVPGVLTLPVPDVTDDPPVNYVSPWALTYLWIE